MSKKVQEVAKGVVQEVRQEAAAKAAKVAELFKAIRKNGADSEAKSLMGAWGRPTQVDPSCENEDGHTPLMAACQKNWYSIVDFLTREKKVNVNQQGKNGDTALMFAVEHENDVVMRHLLFKKGAKVFNLCVCVFFIILFKNEDLYLRRAVALYSTILVQRKQVYLP